ncbi:MAG: hypothetical protein R2758_07985 [Bacteroidales bacterium]
MKKIVINTAFFAGLIAMLVFSGCKEEIDPVVEDLQFSRAFSCGAECHHQQYHYSDTCLGIS